MSSVPMLYKSVEGFGLVALGFLHSLTTVIYSKHSLVCMWVVLILVNTVNSLNFRKTASICMCLLFL